MGKLVDVSFAEASRDGWRAAGSELDWSGLERGRLKEEEAIAAKMKMSRTDVGWWELERSKEKNGDGVCVQQNTTPGRN
ncbi:hypothetical protein BM221_006325 [Beauveria bassiana]|uniref:Uncharacterized protein n=1 Tax=Beauveria bassiana TaxID=176275 RepID=A0A2N6NLJ7_BEABA|nr:hypothetical protein BM221_006325 [Beauveria bassiana]